MSLTTTTTTRSRNLSGVVLIALLLLLREESVVEAFSCRSLYWARKTRVPFAAPSTTAATTCSSTRLASTFYNDFEGYNVDDDDDDDDNEDEEDEEEDDEFLLVDDRDWRTFRKNLSLQEKEDDGSGRNQPPSSVSKENEEVLESQSQQLYTEYKKGIWAHETATVRYILACRPALFCPFSHFLWRVRPFNALCLWPIACRPFFLSRSVLDISSPKWAASSCDCHSKSNSIATTNIP